MFGETPLTALSKPKPRKTDMPMQAIAHTCAPSSPCIFTEGAFTVEATATSARDALAAIHPCHAYREATALVTPAPTILPIYPINDSFFFVEIVYHISLADCLLILDCPYSHVSDYAIDSSVPLRLQQTCFLSVRHPHLLIIALPFTTIRIMTLPCVLLSHFHLMPILLPIRQ